MEAGVGEATSLVPLIKKLGCAFEKVYGFDISWSRIKYAKAFAKENKRDDMELFVGDLFSIPLANCSMDLVYTIHAIEPNGTKEKPILAELYRVARKYLILMEPAYELCGADARARMLKHGYITNLYQSAVDLGYHIIEYSLYPEQRNPLNPTGFLVIKKDAEEKRQTDSIYRCPLTGAELTKFTDLYYAKKSFLAYPIIRDIPCLTQQNTILATKLIDE